MIYVIKHYYVFFRLIFLKALWIAQLPLSHLRIPKLRFGLDRILPRCNKILLFRFSTLCQHWDEQTHKSPNRTSQLQIEISHFFFEIFKLLKLLSCLPTTSEASQGWWQAWAYGTPWLGRPTYSEDFIKAERWQIKCLLTGFPGNVLWLGSAHKSLTQHNSGNPLSKHTCLIR